VTWFSEGGGGGGGLNKTSNERMLLGMEPFFQKYGMPMPSLRPRILSLPPSGQGVQSSVLQA